MSETIDRANRLLSLRANPGFRDAFQMSQAIVDSITATAIDYPGWDMQQLMVLKARAQAAKEHHELFFAQLQEAINDGVREAAASTLPEKTPAEILEQGDYVRQEVLSHFEAMDGDNRIPGSY